MSPDEFHAAVLVFLEQFIARGAAGDIIELSRRLRDDPHERRRLDAHLPSSDPSEREAYDAMVAFFGAEADPDFPGRAHGPSLADLASWTAWGTRDILGNELTQDPAQWHDWLASVHRTRVPPAAEP